MLLRKKRCLNTGYSVVIKSSRLGKRDLRSTGKSRQQWPKNSKLEDEKELKEFSHCKRLIRQNSVNCLTVQIKLAIIRIPVYNLHGDYRL